MQYWQNTHHEPRCMSHQETVYFLQLLLQGAPKTAENAWQKLPKIRSLKFLPSRCHQYGNGEKFNIGAHLQLHLLRFRIAKRYSKNEMPIFIYSDIYSNPG